MNIKGMRNASSSKQGLRELCKSIVDAGRAGTIVEVGVYTGESTVIFAEYMREVYSVDPWRTGYDPKDIASSNNGAYVRKAFVDRTHDIQRKDEYE